MAVSTVMVNVMKREGGRRRRRRRKQTRACVVRKRGCTGEGE
jgi:hypothetical protein